MAGRFGDINLTKYDDLFKDEETRQAEQGEQILTVPLTKSFPMPDSPTP